jgi:hypothetical protein
MTGTICQTLIPAPIRKKHTKLTIAYSRNSWFGRRQLRAHDIRTVLTVKVDIHTAPTMKVVEERSFNSHGRRLLLGVLLNFCKSSIVAVGDNQTEY